MFNIVHELGLMEGLHSTFSYGLGIKLNNIEHIKSLGITLYIMLKLRDYIK